MSLDPTWVWGVLVAGEGLATRQAVVSFRATARFRDRSPEVRQAKEDAYSGVVTEAISELIERTIAFRDPGHETEDGYVEPQPIADVLASTELQDEIASATHAFEEAVDARRKTRRCRFVHLGLGCALIPTMLVMPVVFWPHLDQKKQRLVELSLQHAANTIFVLALAASLILFGLTLRFESQRANALEAHQPDRARVGR